MAHPSPSDCTHSVFDGDAAEFADVEPAAAQIARMKEALERSVVAIDDWLHRYAPEYCDERYVLDTDARIKAGGGVLAYIADIQALNRAALALVKEAKC